MVKMFKKLYNRNGRKGDFPFLSFKEFIREAGAFCLIIVLNYWGLEMGCQLVKK